MAQFDVHPLPGRRGGRGYVVDVQADLLDHLATRVVVPLLPTDAAPPPVAVLNPVFGIGGERHVLMVQTIATVPRRELDRPPVASLEDRRDEIIRALDKLLSGV